MGSGYFQGFALVIPLIILGIQVYIIIAAKLEGEIGTARLLLLLAAALLVLGVFTPWLDAGLLGEGLRLPVTIFMLGLPLLALKMSLWAEELFWNRRSKRALQREIEEWEAVLAAEPGHETACIVLGDLYQKRGEDEKARRCYRAAIERGANRARLEQKLADLDRPVIGRPPASSEDLQTALAELKRLPLLFAVFLAGAILIIFLLYLARFLPAWLTFIIFIILPVVLFMQWLVRR